MKGLVLCLAVLAVLGAAQHDHDHDHHDHDHHEDDGHEHVLSLDSSNFDQTIKNKPLTLVEFYAPWCGHCKKLAPEYEKAAAELFNEVPLAKVDCTKDKDLCTQYGVQGFPTLKYFRDDGTTTDYQAGRTTPDIVKAVRRQNSPAFTVIDSAEALETAKSADVLIVGTFKDAEAEGTAAFKALANKFRNDLSFAIFVNPKQSTPRVVAHRKFDEPEAAHTGEHTAEALENFVRRESFPLLTEIGPENYSKFIDRGFPLFWAFLKMDDEHLDQQEATLTEAAKDFRQLSFVKLDGVKWANHAKNFGLGESLPGLVIEDRNTKKKYVYPSSNLVAAELKKWLKEYAEGKLTPTLKSQEPPASNDEPVKVIVGKTFDQIVMDSTKDVLVEFYAPWCGHCKSLAPKYDELGKEFQDVPSVVIAKVDATENDTPADIQGFPTLLFYRADNKAPLTYSGERSQKAMSDYIRENASTLKQSGSKPHDDL